MANPNTAQYVHNLASRGVNSVSTDFQWNYTAYLEEISRDLGYQAVRAKTLEEHAAVQAKWNEMRDYTVAENPDRYTFQRNLKPWGHEYTPAQIAESNDPAVIKETASRMKHFYSETVNHARALEALNAFEKLPTEGLAPYNREQLLKQVIEKNLAAEASANSGVIGVAENGANFARVGSAAIKVLGPAGFVLTMNDIAGVLTDHAATLHDNHIAETERNRVLAEYAKTHGDRKNDSVEADPKSLAAREEKMFSGQRNGTPESQSDWRYIVNNYQDKTENATPAAKLQVIDAIEKKVNDMGLHPFVLELLQNNHSRNNQVYDVHQELTA